MDSDGRSEASFSDVSSIVESVPKLDDIVARLEQEITAWLKTRADASSLDIVAAYDELRHLDIKEKLLLPKKKDHRPPKGAAVGIRDSKWDVIRRAFELRRQLLRSRALDLSRSRLRPLKGTDLPLDILHIIFHNFQDDAMTEGQDRHCIVSWSDYEATRSHRRRRTVHKLRLVCRLFYDVATPLLFPVLRVQLTRSSLNLIERISTSPDIAAGVRGIQVSLGYRPKEYAESITQFTRLRLGVLDQCERRCSYELEDWEDQDFSEDSEDKRVPSKSVRRATKLERMIELRRAMNNYICLENDWEEYVRIADCGEVFVGPLTQYQDILQKGYAEYCRLQEEQQDILENDGFANVFAAAVSRMPNVHCLNFVDKWDPNASRPTRAKVLNDNGLLSRFMSAPLRLQDIELERERSEVAACKLECVRLLWELPIALHRAGVSVTQISMSKLSVSANFLMLFAQDHNGLPTWDDLAAACEQLEFFKLELTENRVIGALGPSDKNESYLDNFVGAILSRCGQHLRTLKLDFHGLCIETESYHAFSFLSKLQELPRIRHVDLRYLRLRGKTLNGFCRGLGEKLGRLVLCKIMVQGGVWGDVINMLRKRMAATVATNMVADSKNGLRVSLEFLSEDEWESLSEDESESLSEDESEFLSECESEYLSEDESDYLSEDESDYLSEDEFGMGTTEFEGPLAQAAARDVTGMVDFNPYSLKDVCTCGWGDHFPCNTEI